MKKLGLFILCLLSLSSNLFAYRGIYSSHTGRIDYVGVGASSDVAVVCDSGKILQSSGGGTWTCASASATSWTNIGDATGDTTIALGEYKTTLSSNLDEGSAAVLKIANTDADAANDNYFIHLTHDDGDDANVYYLLGIGDANETPQTDYSFSQTAALIRPALTVTGKITGNGSVDVKNGATSSGIVSIFEDSDDGSNKATFQVPALAADTAYTLPADDGDSNQVLSTNGSGVLDWVAASAAASGSGFPFGPVLTDIKYPAVFSSNVAVGDTDLYTVPAGKKAIATALSVYNASGSTIVYFLQIKVSSTYYRAGTNISLTTTSQTSNVGISLPILEAGESFSINTDVQGLNVWLKVVEYDDDVPIKSYRILSLANGDNTLMTVPALKTSFILAANRLAYTNGASIAYVNDSGGSRTITAYAVPSGGAAGTTNQVEVAGAVGDDTLQSINFNGNLSSGDTLVVNTNSGTTVQSAWVNVVEV